MDTRDYATETPAPLEKFEGFKRLCSYDRTTPLDSKSLKESENEHWLRERANFTTVYGDYEPMSALLFLPKGVGRPFETIMFFPGVGAGKGRFHTVDRLQRPDVRLQHLRQRVLVVRLFHPVGTRVEGHRPFQIGGVDSLEVLFLEGVLRGE